MHRCAVHKLTNWHIRLMSNTNGAVTSRLQVRDMVTQVHLIIYMFIADSQSIYDYKK